MAAAVASGAVADLISGNPGLTPNQVKSALIHSARDVPGVGVEVAVDRAIDRVATPTLVAALPAVNQGLTPNEAIDPATGLVNWERARWTRARWTDAAEALRARWTRARWTSYTCDCWDAGTDVAPTDAVNEERARWTRARWTRARWTRARWTMSFTK